MVVVVRQIPMNEKHKQHPSGSREWKFRWLNGSAILLVLASGCAAGPNWKNAFLGLPMNPPDEAAHSSLPSAELRTGTRDRQRVTKQENATQPLMAASAKATAATTVVEKKVGSKTRMTASISDDAALATPPQSIANATFTKPIETNNAAPAGKAPATKPQVAKSLTSAPKTAAKTAVAKVETPATEATPDETEEIAYPTTHLPSLEDFIAANFAELKKEISLQQHLAAEQEYKQQLAKKQNPAANLEPPAVVVQTVAHSEPVAKEPASPSDQPVKHDSAVKQASASVDVESPKAAATLSTPDIVTAKHTGASPKKETPSHQVGDWAKARDQAIVAAEEEIRLAKQDPARRAEIPQLETQLRLLYAMAGRRDEAAKAIEGLREEEQEFWKHEAFGLVDLLAADRLASESRRYSAALQSFEEARHHLATAGTLTLKNMAFCRKVEDFGRIEKFDRHEFTRNQEVLLYVEVRNFGALHTKAGYETELQGSYRVLDRAGTARSERMLPLDRQTCSNHRHDYYIAYRIYIPTELQPGAYSLELSIEDKKGSKSNNALLDFNVMP
jgi:hypothetical protein